MKVERFQRMFFIVIIMSLLILSGCSYTPKYQCGNFSYGFSMSDPMIGVRGETDIFPVDAVNLELCYAMHNMEYDEKYQQNPKDSYDYNGHDEVFFVLYFCEEGHELDICNDMEIADYKNVDYYEYIKEVSEEEAFTGDYSYTMSYWKGIEYTHSEEIHIPEKYFSKEKGKVSIKIQAYNYPLEGEDKYYTASFKYVEIDYEKTEDGKVRIKY